MTDLFVNIECNPRNTGTQRNSCLFAQIRDRRFVKLLSGDIDPHG